MNKHKIPKGKPLFGIFDSVRLYHTPLALRAENREAAGPGQPSRIRRITKYSPLAGCWLCDSKT
ncbi:MAG: hypothetical protein FWD58_00085 [Firmicutes bacterium]|nr:hypothetical protein [Bacillota bacterium]